MGNKLQDRMKKIGEFAGEFKRLVMLIEDNRLSERSILLFAKPSSADKEFKTLLKNIRQHLIKTEKAMKKAINII